MYRVNKYQWVTQWKLCIMIFVFNVCSICDLQTWGPGSLQIGHNHLHFYLVHGKLKKHWVRGFKGVFRFLFIFLNKNALYTILQFLDQNIRIRNSSLKCPAQEYGCIYHIYRQEFYFFMTGVDLNEKEYIYIIVFNATLKWWLNKTTLLKKYIQFSKACFWISSL